MTPTSGFSSFAVGSELLLAPSYEDFQLRSTPAPVDPEAGFSGDPNLPKRLHVTNIPFRYR